jgi:hypothetical protein
MLIKYWYFQDRDLAKNIESKVLKTLRNKFPTAHLNKEDMPQHGYTEAFSAKVISSKKVIALINKEIKNHSPQ